MPVTTTIESNYDRKLEIVSSDLKKEYSNLLKKIPKRIRLTVLDYMKSLNAEVNPSVNYRKDIMKCLTRFCHYKQFLLSSPLKKQTNLRKSETADPLHRWIGTYNLYRVHLIRFFKCRDALKVSIFANMVLFASFVAVTKLSA